MALLKVILVQQAQITVDDNELHREAAVVLVLCPMNIDQWREQQERQEGERPPTALASARLAIASEHLDPEKRQLFTWQGMVRLMSSVSLKDLVHRCRNSETGSPRCRCRNRSRNRISAGSRPRSRLRQRPETVSGLSHYCTSQASPKTDETCLSKSVSLSTSHRSARPSIPISISISISISIDLDRPHSCCTVRTCDICTEIGHSRTSRADHPPH